MTKLLLVVFFGLLGVFSLSAQIIVKGIVKDDSGEFLPGVNVIVTSTALGVVTDLNGNYTIEVPDNHASLTFSFIGMQTVTEVVGERTTINIQMKNDTQVLETVMVVAYGNTTKEAFTGSAQVVDKKVLADRPTTSFEKALQGSSSGLLVTNSSGQPGSSASIRIRGVGSLSASSAPLIVLDGLPMSGSITDINPNDIESITILKDAAAASLYGSRAANGVILVTTKMGTKGTTQISFTGQLGLSSRISTGYPLMNSTQIYEHSWMGLYNKAILEGNNVDDAKLFANGNVNGIVGFNPFGVDNPLDNDGKVKPGTQVITNTNWRDNIYKNGVVQNYNLNVSGGSELTKVFFSLGYFDDSGTVLSSNFKRLSNKVNVTHKINRILTTGVKTHLSYSITNAPPEGSGGANPVRSAEVINAASPVRNGDGSFNWDNKAIFDFNPVGLAELDKYEYETKRAIVNTFLSIDFLPKFNFRTTIGIDNSINKGVNYYNPEHGNGAGVNGRSTISSSDDNTWNISNLLTYSTTFKNNILELLAGQEALRSMGSLLSAGVTNFSIPGYYDLVWGAEPQSPASYESAWSMVSYFGQAKYDINDLYYLTGSIRTDGSSRFGENNKYGLFYSLGVGWRLSQESWMPKFSWLENLKLRASYGTSGNNSIGNYASLGLYGSGANYSGFPGLTPIQLANNDLSWERISSFNVGVESKLFNKLDVTLEYYSRKSDGLLYAQPLSSAKGFNSILTNLAAMKNSGLEATLAYTLVNTDRLSSSIGFNISTNSNEILNLNTERIVSGTKLLEEGASIYQFYMREWAGVDPNNGKPMWFVNESSDDKKGGELPTSAFPDPKGSGREVTSNYSDAERIRLGTALPKVFGGLNYNVRYQGFELSIYTYYNVGGKVYNFDYATNMHDGTQPGSNLSSDALQAWTPNNRSTNVPRYVVNNTDQGNEMSSRFLESASYLRLKNLTLSYNLPQHVCDRFKLKKVRIFYSGENLLTFTNYKGFDPEVAINGTTSNSIPGTKVSSLGFKIDL